VFRAAAAPAELGASVFGPLVGEASHATGTANAVASEASHAMQK
jgi:phosphogluconate dehydratase